MYLDGTTVKYEAFSDGRRFTYMYDANGELYAVRLATYSNPTASAIYYYVYNLQGDVIALVNSANGQIVARYEYDAWGKITAVTDANGNAITDQSHIAHVNPFRYRGYYYDNETGLYYLNTRYYDPDTGRFITPDDSAVLEAEHENMAQYNLYAYCFNNPVNMEDDGGYWPAWLKKAAAAVTVVAAVAAVAAITVATAGAGTAAAVIAVGAAKGAAIGMASGAAIGAATGAVNHRVSTGSWKGAGTAALNGMGDGALSGAITGAITGAAGSAVKVGQAAKAWNKGTFKSSVKSMNHHYKNKVINQGYGKGNNVIKYTNDALDFASKNSSYFKYQYSLKYGHSRWFYSNSYGGGYYANDGSIYTFWYKR